MIFGEDCISYIILLTGRPVWGAGSYLMLMRYCAKATLSAFPLIVMVLSRLAGASLSSQFEILIIAPESCLEKNSNVDSTVYGNVCGNFHRKTIIVVGWLLQSPC